MEMKNHEVGSARNNNNSNKYNKRKQAVRRLLVFTNSPFYVCLTQINIFENEIKMQFISYTPFNYIKVY